MSGRCGACEVSGDLAHASPAYRRALVIVIALNLGMGVAEMAGGLLGASQALKADALDFLGDGSITLSPRACTIGSNRNGLGAVDP